MMAEREIDVAEAANRLGVGPSRVRQMLAAADLRGRRLGRDWRVSAEDVARLEGRRRPSGRPLGPLRAWAVLDLLGGGTAPWLAASSRSQVRARLSRVDNVDADGWRHLLRGRSDVHRIVAHRASVSRLADDPRVLVAGSVEASTRGFDLVALPGGPREVYLPDVAWPELRQSLALRDAGSDEANLVVHVPRKVWPFASDHAVSEPALAADLIDAAEPRAVSAGERRLAELLDAWRRR